MQPLYLALVPLERSNFWTHTLAAHSSTDTTGGLWRVLSSSGLASSLLSLGEPVLYSMLPTMLRLTFISCIILFMSIIHDDRLGPLSTHARTQRELKQDVETGTPQSIEDVDKEPEKEDSTHVAPVRPHSAQTADQAYPEV